MVSCSFEIKNGIHKTIGELRDDPLIGEKVRKEKALGCSNNFEVSFLWILFLHGLIYRILAYLAMNFLNSEKKK